MEKVHVLIYYLKIYCSLTLNALNVNNAILFCIFLISVVKSSINFNMVGRLRY